MKQSAFDLAESTIKLLVAFLTPRSWRLPQAEVLEPQQVEKRFPDTVNSFSE